MKCEDCLIWMEEYFDGELDARQGREVEAHMRDCADCAAFYQALGQEQEIYAHYRRDVEVSPTLWRAVQSGIRQATATAASVAGSAASNVAASEAPTNQTGDIAGESWASRARRFFAESFAAPRFSPALAALLVVVAVGATVAVMKLSEAGAPQNPTIAGNADKKASSETPASTAPATADSSMATTAEKAAPRALESTPPEANNPLPQPQEFAPKVVKTSPDAAVAKASRQPSAADSTDTAERLLKDAEKKYLAAISILERNFNRRRSQMDAALVAKLDTALGSIDTTIAETRKAIRQNPNDPIALQYMLAAYAKKVEVLRDVTAD